MEERKFIVDSTPARYEYTLAELIAEGSITTRDEEKISKLEVGEHCYISGAERIDRIK